VSFPVHSAEKNAEELARLEKEMSAQKKAAEELDAVLQLHTGELGKLRNKLISATSSLQEKQEEKNKLEDKLEAIEKETRARADNLKQSRERLSRLTSGLVQLSREPPALFALRESSAVEHVHRSVLLRSLLPRLKQETETLLDEISYFNDLQRQAGEQKSLMTAASQNLVWQRHNLDQLVKARQGRLQKTQAERDAINRQLEALASEAKNLKQLMEKVSSYSWGKTLGKTKEGPAPSLGKELRTPVAGKLIRGFGEKDEFGVESEGLTYASSSGAPVVAPQSGRIVFMGPFQGYGKVIIMQHDGGNHSFLAGLGRIDTELGQSVAAGEPLGIMPTDGDKRLHLYFEWRKNKKPVNPVF
jgi:septal ring factor EnvC (AmiA/AmiB activator)